MAQAAKIIDITQSYVPIDPATYPVPLHGTRKEDTPIDTAPIVAYQGWNFLPTGYGYKSYFGTADRFASTPLTSRVNKIFIVQSATYDNTLVALCEDGIWLNYGSSWFHSKVLTFDSDFTKEWTYAVVGTEVYCYRAQNPILYRIYLGSLGSPEAVPGYNYTDTANPINPNFVTALSTGAGAALPVGLYQIKLAVRNAAGEISQFLTIEITLAQAAVDIQLLFPHVPDSDYVLYYVAPDNSISMSLVLGNNDFGTVQLSLVSFVPMADFVSENTLVEEITPTFLNMEGQQGIFAAGMRLAFWDSANSIAWSSIDDAGDYTPSIQTLAGSAIFSQVVGRITHVLPHGDGFIIYSAKSIVLVRQDESATFLWDPTQLVEGAGVAYPMQVTASYPNLKHFAFTNIGIAEIEEGRLKWIVPELYDTLKNMDSPVYLQVVQGRYLFFQIIDDGFLFNRVVFTTGYVPSETFTLTTTPLAEDLFNAYVSGGAGLQDVLANLASNRYDQGPARVANGRLADDEDSPWYRSEYDLILPNNPPSEIETWEATTCTQTLEMIPSISYDEDGWLNPPTTTLEKTSFTDILQIIPIARETFNGIQEAQRAYVNAILARTQEITTAGPWTSIGNEKIYGGGTRLPAEGETIISSAVCAMGRFPYTLLPGYIKVGSCETTITAFWVEAVDIETLIKNTDDRDYNWKKGGYSFDAPSVPADLFPGMDAACESIGLEACPFSSDPYWPNLAGNTSRHCQLPGENCNGSAAEAWVFVTDLYWGEHVTTSKRKGSNRIAEIVQGIFGTVTVTLRHSGWSYSVDGEENFVPRPNNVDCWIPDYHEPDKSPSTPGATYEPPELIIGPIFNTASVPPLSFDDID